jgi:hypothetical protein
MMGFSTQEYINRVGRRPGAPQPVSLAIGRASVGTGSSAVKVEGLEHFKAQLANLTAQMRRRVLGNALRAGAREIRDTAKRNAPVLCGRNLSAPYRKPGTRAGRDKRSHQQDGAQGGGCWGVRQRQAFAR